MRTFLLSAITLILVFLGAILMFIRGNAFITPALSPEPTPTVIVLPTPIVIELKETSTPPIAKPSTSFECPQGAWINCMPIIEKSRAYQCEKEFISWAENTCPGFEGVAY